MFSQFVAVLPTDLSISVVPHFLRRRIHPCFPTSQSPFSSAAVTTADIVCHTCYPSSPPILHCYHPACLLRSLSHYLPSFRVPCRRCLSTCSDQIFSLLCVVLYYTACSALIQTTFLTFHSDLLTTIFCSLLARLFSLSVMLFLCSNLPRFFLTCLQYNLLQSDHSSQICLLLSAFSISDMVNSDWSALSLIWLFRSSLIIFLRSALSFVPLELLISLKITYRYVTHHLPLACIIT